MTRQDVPGPPSGRMLRGAESEVEQTHNYIIVASGAACMKRSGTAMRTSSGVIAELCIQGSRARTRRPTERLVREAETPRRLTA